MAPEEQDIETSGGPPDVPPELYRTLHTLDDLVEAAPQRMGHATSVPLEEFHALTDRLREDLPRAIVQAEELSEKARQAIEDARREADRLVGEARAETERLLEEARKRAAVLVTESPEVQFANAQRRDITAQAQQAALNVRQDADTYARETLDRLEDMVRRLQNQIRSGLVALDREKGKAAGAPKR